MGTYLRKTFLFVSFLLYCLRGSTQDPKILDSLKNQLSLAKEDTHKVNTLIELSNQTRNINVPSSIKYAEDALSLARKLQFQRGQAIALYAIGRRQLFTGRDSIVAKHLTTALSIFESLGDKSYQARTHEGISDIYLNSANYAEALKHLSISLELREQIGNGNGISKNILDKIFQPFFTTKPTGQGTGLGLSLAYDNTKTPGGGIAVETKENEGSEFIITLPAKR